MSGRACQSREVHSAPVERQNPVRLGIRLVGKQETVGAAWNVVSRTDPRESPAGVRIASGPRSGNLALRQQLAVYQRRHTKPRLRDQDRRFWSLLARVWPGWRATLVFVQPDTVVRWHRLAWRRYWTWKSRKHGPGRPRIDRALRELIVQMARENPRWGAVRIVGELRARLRRQRTHGRPLPSMGAPATAITDVAHIPA